MFDHLQFSVFHTLAANTSVNFTRYSYFISQTAIMMPVKVLKSVVTWGYCLLECGNCVAW